MILICNRCNKLFNSRSGLRYMIHTIPAGKKQYNLCGACCATLVVLSLNTRRLTSIDLDDFIAGHSERLYERYIK